MNYHLLACGCLWIQIEFPLQPSCRHGSFDLFLNEHFLLQLMRWKNISTQNETWHLVRPAPPHVWRYSYGFVAAVDWTDLCNNRNSQEGRHGNPAAFLSHCIMKMSHSLKTNKELCLMDSETKPSTLTVQSDKFAGSHIHQQVLLARFLTNPIYLIMLLR